MGKLRIIIFNVEHGFCAFIKSPNNYTLLIDCGGRENFSPIKYIIENELNDINRYTGYALTQFILTHPHDDHLSEIKRLMSDLKPAFIVRQKYNWEEIKYGENKKIYENLDIYSSWQEIYKNENVVLPDWGMELYHYDHLEPSQAIQLNKSNYVNNSSIVVIIKYNNLKFIFPGDLEQDGWLKLLENQSFRESINNTSFFIASHHGHTSGYCKEVFNYSGKPYFNIVSARSRDENVEKAYSSSDTAKGLQYDGQLRYMLSTRKDGSIIIEVNEEGKTTFKTFNIEDNIKNSYWS